MVANTRKEVACVLNWRSKKLKRVIASSLAGEALAMTAVIGEMVYGKAILEQIYGDAINTIPVVIYTDSTSIAREEDSR